MVVRTKLLGFLALVILFGWTNRVAAQVSDDVTSRIEQARTMMLQMRLTDASLLLDMPGLNPEEQGLIWFQKGYIPLLEVLLTDREQAYDAFFTYSDAARSFLDGQPNTSWFNWLRAEVVMQRAWVWAKRGDNVRAALAFNAAYQFLDRVKKEGSSNSELQKGLGLMHLAIGALPSR